MRAQQEEKDVDRFLFSLITSRCMYDKSHSEAGQDESEEHYIKQWRKTILGMKWQKRDSLAEL